MKFKSTVTVDRVRELLNYDPTTGLFTWRVQRNNRVKAGSVAGSVVASGHVLLKVDNKSVLAHRAAWALTQGGWPETDVDHINGAPADNRIVNLRVVSRGHNLQNQRRAHSDSVSGLLGVKRKVGKACVKWEAKIYANGKDHRLGSFDTPEAASAAYLAAKRELHPGCTI